MPIIFISKLKKFTDYMLSKNQLVLNIDIENYVPTTKTYYVSPANSLCYMV